MNRINKLYLKMKILVNNDFLYPLGFSNTIIKVVEMEEIDIRKSKFKI